MKTPKYQIPKAGKLPVLPSMKSPISDDLSKPPKTPKTNTIKKFIVKLHK